MRRFCLCLVMSLLLPLEAWAEVVDVKTRDSKIRVLIEGPDNPSHVVAIFAGGSGNTQIKANGKIGKGRGNFAVRTRGMFHGHGMATAVVTSPRDMKNLKHNRNTAEYATDVENVMAHLRGRFAGVPIWMHGTSRGTISITLTITKFKNPANKPDGIVLSASVTEDNSSGDDVFKGELGAITAAALVIHHEGDLCHVTPPADAPKLLKALDNAKPKKLIMISGGGESARGGDCQAKTHHGFIDVEQKTIDAMATWIRNPK